MQLPSVTLQSKEQSLWINSTDITHQDAFDIQELAEPAVIMLQRSLSFCEELSSDEPARQARAVRSLVRFWKNRDPLIHELVHQISSQRLMGHLLALLDHDDLEVVDMTLDSLFAVLEIGHGRKKNMEDVRKRLFRRGHKRNGVLHNPYKILILAAHPEESLAKLANGVEEYAEGLLHKKDIHQINRTVRLIKKLTKLAGDLLTRA